MNQDRKLVAHEQQWEFQYIVDKFQTTKELVESVMLQLGKNGKYCRSRRMIYAKIREMLEVKESV